MTLLALMGFLCIAVIGLFTLLCLQNTRLKQQHIETREIDRSQQQIVTLLQQQAQQLQQLQHLQGTQQREHLQWLQEALLKGMQEIRQQVSEALSQQAHFLGQRVEHLTQETQARLRDMTARVDQQLSEGFAKTTQTFTHIVERIALIDEAQKKIAELSGNVVSLQNILHDKRSRGAFGEVQLALLVRNMLPENQFALQYELSNKTRVDCLLFLPPPTYNLPIDSKFPLETYRLLQQNPPETEVSRLRTQFKNDLKKHIRDIATKYLIPGETSDGAILFIPSESIFAEIHAHYPDIVEEAHQRRVWLASPTTLMAILTTVLAVLKDAATREQVHLIQDHLVALGQDFGRFQQRMDQLARHINQAQQDVEEVHRSSKKLSSRFSQIEKVELPIHETLSRPLSLAGEGN